MNFSKGQLLLRKNIDKNIVAILHATRIRKGVEITGLITTLKKLYMIKLILRAQLQKLSFST